MKSRKYQWLQWRETSSAPDGGRTSAAHHVGGVGRFLRTGISKFHIVRYQFAELKISHTLMLEALCSKIVNLITNVFSYTVQSTVINKCYTNLSPNKSNDINRMLTYKRSIDDSTVAPRSLQTADKEF